MPIPTGYESPGNKRKMYKKDEKIDGKDFCLRFQSAPDAESWIIATCPDSDKPGEVSNFVIR